MLSPYWKVSFAGFKTLWLVGGSRRTSSVSAEGSLPVLHRVGGETIPDCLTLADVMQASVCKEAEFKFLLCL